MKKLILFVTFLLLPTISLSETLYEEVYTLKDVLAIEQEYHTKDTLSLWQDSEEFDRLIYELEEDRGTQQSSMADLTANVKTYLVLDVFYVFNKDKHKKKALIKSTVDYRSLIYKRNYTVGFRFRLKASYEPY